MCLASAVTELAKRLYVVETRIEQDRLLHLEELEKVQDRLIELEEKGTEDFRIV